MGSYKGRSKLVPSDFCIRYNTFRGEGEKEITERLLHTLIVKRLKSNKPVVWFIGGDSGEGKSSTALTLQVALCNSIRVDMMEALEPMNVTSPMEYATKLKNILYSDDKLIKKLRCFCIHEARTLVASRDWSSELSGMISDVNAMSRVIKPLCMIVISQFIRDITKDVRYTLTYYSTISRPLGRPYGILKLYRMYKDDRDLEKPKIKKRLLKGYFMKAKHINADPVKESDWERRWVVLDEIKLFKPPKEIYEKFKELDAKGKTDVILNKLDKMNDTLQVQADVEGNRIDQIAEESTQSVSSLAKVGRKYKGEWKVNKKTRELYRLNKDEAKLLEEKINNIVRNNNFDGDLLDTGG